MKYLIAIFLVQLINGVIINEFQSSTGIVETLNRNSGSSDFFQLLVYDQDRNKIFQKNLDAVIGAYETHNLNLPNPKPSQILIVTFLNQFGSRQTDYNSLPHGYDSSILDSFVYTKNPLEPSVFSDKFPQWNGIVPYVDHGETLSKCGPLIPHQPSAFFATFNTLGAENNCRELFPDPVGGGDPHFVQPIKDFKTHNIVNICYDVTGASQQSIFIFEEFQSNIKVEGVLFDDYYLHQVKVNIHGYSMKIDRKSISYKQKVYEWLKSSFIVINNLRIVMKKNKLEIEILDKNLNTDFRINVLKSSNLFGLEHLDVSIAGLKMENKYGGLIGDIYQQNISMVTNDVLREHEISVDVNNQIIKGKLEKRFQHNCIFVSVHDLIKPKSIKDYVYE